MFKSIIKSKYRFKVIPMDYFDDSTNFFPEPDAVSFQVKRFKVSGNNTSGYSEESNVP